MISVATPKAVVSYFLFFSWLLKIDFSGFFFCSWEDLSDHQVYV